MLYRIIKGEYGQDSERELMSLNYNITVRVYDEHSNCWIVNREDDPKGDRVISIMWDRKSAHYDLLIPEGDNVVENRPRQLQHIYSRSSLQVQSPSRFTSHTNKPSCLDLLKREFKHGTTL